MLKDLTKKNSAAVPLTPAGRDVRRPRVGADRRPNVIAMDEVSATTTATSPTRSLPRRRQVRRDRRSAASSEPSFAVIAPSALGAGRALAPRRRRQDPARATGIFGIVRWRVKKDKPAFSADRGRLEQGPLRDRHRHAGQGRARRRGLARRQAARAGLQPGLVAFRLWLADDPEDFALSSAKQTPVRACKVTWRGDSKELMVVAGRRGLRGGRRPCSRASRPTTSATGRS